MLHALVSFQFADATQLASGTFPIPINLIAVLLKLLSAVTANAGGFIIHSVSL